VTDTAQQQAGKVNAAVAPVAMSVTVRLAATVPAINIGGPGAVAPDVVAATATVTAPRIDTVSPCRTDPDPVAVAVAFLATPDIASSLGVAVAPEPVVAAAAVADADIWTRLGVSLDMWPQPSLTVSVPDPIIVTGLGTEALVLSSHAQRTGGPT
jgi:hypothetical protein